MVFMSDDNLSASARNESDTIVIKVGTKVITNKKGYLDMEQIQNLARQINDLKKYYKRIILVTSGAVAAGREVLGKKARKIESVSTQQLYSAAGQVPLMEAYRQALKNCIQEGSKEDPLVAYQLLLTRHNFSSKKECKNIRGFIERAFAEKKEGIVIMNENDPVATDELEDGTKFSDNDHLTEHISSMMKARMAVLLSDNGICEDPNEPNTIIREIEPGSNGHKKHLRPGKSKLTRGGIIDKDKYATQMQEQGIDVHVANGRTENVIPRILVNGEKGISTHYKPADVRTV